MGSGLIILMNVMWKWGKSLLTVILLEGCSVMILAGLFSYGGDTYSALMFLVLTFFVSEALILLSSMLWALRSSGAMSSMIVLS